MAFKDPFEAEGEPSDSSWMACLRRRSPSSMIAAATGSMGTGGDEEDGDGDGDEDVDWEEELRRRLKELEEMKELEKRAEELVAEGTAGDREETEEEKRERVRKELEKVPPFPSLVFAF